MKYSRPSPWFVNWENPVFDSDYICPRRRLRLRRTSPACRVNCMQPSAVVAMPSQSGGERYGNHGNVSKSISSKTYRPSLAQKLKQIMGTYLIVIIQLYFFLTAFRTCYELMWPIEIAVVKAETAVKRSTQKNFIFQGRISKRKRQHQHSSFVIRVKKKHIAFANHFLRAPTAAQLKR